MNLTKLKIGNILELQRGYDLSAKEMQKGDVAVVGSNGIIGYHNIERSNFPCITVGRSGSVGKVHYYEQPTWAHNTALYVKDFKGNDPKYLYYFLQNLHLDELFGKSNSVVPSLDRKVVHSMSVCVIKDIAEQKRIASILSNLDRKIALNRSINANLETLARQLYDYWFVQFDFPDANGKPYKSSGGKMVYSEKLKREIPEGWEVKKIDDLYNVINERITPSQILANDKYTPIEVIPRHKMTFSECVPLKEAISGLCRYMKEDILLSNRRVYFHKVCIAPFDGITRDTVIVLRPKDDKNLGYLFQVVFSEHFIRFSTVVSYGSEQPVLSWNDAKEYLAIVPNNKLDLLYSKKVESIIEKIINTQYEIASLTRQRDELLPLLMNGQVTVE